MSSTPVDSPKEGSSRARTAHPAKSSMSARDLKECKTIVKSLIKHKVGWPFAEPVDPVKLDIPDYFEIIKNPMDLGTINKRLEKNFYSTTEQLQSDINLVFNNAIRYNPPGSDICLMVDQLKKFFESKWSSKFGTSAPDSPSSSVPPAVPTEKAKTPKPNPNSSSKNPQTPQSAPLQRKRKTEPEEVTPRSENKPKSSSGGAPSSSNKPLPMSFEEKKKTFGREDKYATSKPVGNRGGDHPKSNLFN